MCNKVLLLVEWKMDDSVSTLMSILLLFEFCLKMDDKKDGSKEEWFIAILIDRAEPHYIFYS